MLQLALNFDAPLPRSTRRRASSNPAITALAERIIGWRHSLPDDAWLTATGWREWRRDKNGRSWMGTGPSGIRTGWALGTDPYAIAACVGFGLVGMLWADAFPGLMRAVDQVHKAQRKADMLARAKEEGVLP